MDAETPGAGETQGRRSRVVPAIAAAAVAIAAAAVVLTMSGGGEDAAVPVSRASETEDAASGASESASEALSPTTAPTPEETGPPLAPEVENVAQLLLKKAPKGYRRLPSPPDFRDGIDLREAAALAERPKLARRELRSAGYRRGAARYWVEPEKLVLMSMVSEFKDAEGAQHGLWMEESSAVGNADVKRFRFKGIPGAVTMRLPLEGDYAHALVFAKGHRLYILTVIDIQGGRSGRGVLKDAARRQYQIG